MARGSAISPKTIGMTRIRHRHSVGAAPVFVGVEPLAQPLLAELVVELALLGVGQDVERVVHLLEARLRLVIPRVLVGVQRLGELPVGFLDGRLV